MGLREWSATKHSGGASSYLTVFHADGVVKSASYVAEQIHLVWVKKPFAKYDANED